MLMLFVIIICVDGIGINPAQTAGRWRSFTRSGLLSAASACNKCHFVSRKLLFVSKCHTGLEKWYLCLFFGASIHFPYFLSFLSLYFLLPILWNDTSSCSHCLLAWLRFSCLSLIITDMQMNGSVCLLPHIVHVYLPGDLLRDQMISWDSFNRLCMWISHITWWILMMCFKYTIPHCCEFIPLTKCFFTDVFHPALLVI